MVIKTEWFVRGFVESVFVVGSILLALGVDAWSENREFAELADQSLGIFEQEIIQNRDRVADGLPYHQGIRDLLGQMLATPPPVIDLRRIMEGLEPPVLLSTAWETALATGALTHMDFEVVSALSLTYSFQEDFETRSRSDRPRIGGGEDQSTQQVGEQVRTAYEYVAALTRDETELLTIFQQALAVVAQHRGGEPVDSMAAGEPEGS
jgi:hypothetical protein